MGEKYRGSGCFSNKESVSGTRDGTADGDVQARVGAKVTRGRLHASAWGSKGGLGDGLWICVLDRDPERVSMR